MDNIQALLKKYIQFITKKTRELREDRNALIFLVFLLLSACFWVLNALRKDDYTTEVSYPVRFVNVGEDEIVKGSLKRDLHLRIRGGGFKILPYHLRQQFTATAIDISALSRVNVDGVDGAYLNSIDYFKLIEGKLAVGVELEAIMPDTLFIPLIAKERKKLPVKVVADYSFERQCQLSGSIKVSPDSVMVAGAGDVLDTLSYIPTRPLFFENLSDTIVRNVQLDVNPSLELSKRRVVVTLPVEPYTEARINVPIKSLNLPDSVDLKTFPPAIEVSYHIGLTRPLFQVNDFAATIDFASIRFDDLPRRLKVRVQRAPEDIQNMSFRPVFVEYLLEKK
ncbi:MULTISPECIES: YbbR-like domain-containing protein [unclassified Carboxylicivirga]|uniref:YbbR-like domain-containing protein n=1 Tax=Carboxylicivirga TaxID=1628153 RepID=UPI003D325B23